MIGSANLSSSALAPPHGETRLFLFLTGRQWHLVYMGWIHILLLSDLVFSSRLNRIILYPLSQQVTLSVFIASTVGAVGIGLAGLYWASTFACCLAIVVIFWQVVHFADVSGFPLLITTGFQFMPVATFLFFFIVVRAGLRDYLLKWLVHYAFLYTLFYLVMSAGFKAGIVPYGLVSPLLLTDVERGDRIVHYGAMTSLAWFFFLHAWMTSRRKQDLFAVLVCAAAIIISLSRVYILLTFVLTALFLLRFDRRLIAAASVSIMFSAAFILLAGIADDQFNPFSFFSSDSSGNARAIEYEVAQHFLRLDPLQGVGLAQSSYELGFLTGNYYFSASDLGLLGVWWDFGLLGLVLFVAGSIVVCLWNRSVGTAYSWPLFLTGCSLAAYGCISPTIFYPGGATVFALLLGVWFDDRMRSRDGRPVSRGLTGRA